MKTIMMMMMMMMIPCIGKYVAVTLTLLTQQLLSIILIGFIKLNHDSFIIIIIIRLIITVLYITIAIIMTITLC